MLRRRLATRAGVRFFATRDELTWIENYSFLLRQASGRYFRLLSQDDWILPGTMSHAIAALEAAPEAVVAYGPVEAADRDGNLLAPYTLTTGRETVCRGWWRRFHTLVVFGGVRYRGAKHGLIRRVAYAESDLVLPATYSQTGLSFRAWFFALSLRGPFCLVPDYVSWQCVHAESFGATHLHFSPGEKLLILWDYYRIGLRFWRTAATNPLERWIAAPLLLATATLMIPVLLLVRNRERRMFRRAKIVRARGLH